MKTQRFVVLIKENAVTAPSFKTKPVRFYNGKPLT